MATIIKTTNNNVTLGRYLGAKDKITATFFYDTPKDILQQGLESCTYADCRNYAGGNDYYHNLVFANPQDSSSNLTNDKTSFLIEYPSTSATATYSLEQYGTTGWVFRDYLTGSTYGTNYAFSSLANANLRGYLIDWLLVYGAFGEGIFRFKASSTIEGVSSCLASQAYCLKYYNCRLAHGTVKFEAYITGLVGKWTDRTQSGTISVQDQAELTDLTDVNWYMSLRVPGFFGYEKTDYERESIEYENGEIIKVRDEAIQKYEYASGRLPKAIHDQLKIYFFMADKLMVTDFNENNSDYFVNRKQIVCDGNYAPEYKVNSRLSRVRVEFKDKFQNMIKRLC